MLSWILDDGLYYRCFFEACQFGGNQAEVDITGVTKGIGDP